MKLTLGFTTQFYTLWEVSEPTKKYTSGATVNGVFSGTYYMVVKYTYLQNLSKDYDAAIQKITEISGGDFAIDLDLRSTRSFNRAIDGAIKNDMPDYVFTFGQLQGTDIREATDVYQLTRAAREELGKRRRAYARKRLIDLGELVRNTVGAGKSKWVTPKELKYLQDKNAKQEATGHFFEKGKRITVAVRKIGGTHFEGQFGTIYIREYLTEDGKLIKYKGSSPLDIPTDQYVIVAGTVEHGEYKGQPETRLKRMKKIME